MKDFLIKLIARKKEEMKKLQERSDASQDLAEVRAIGETLAALKKEIEEAEAKLAELDGDDSGDDSGEGTGEASRSGVIPDGAVLRNGVVVGSTGQAKTEDNEGMEYRKAFMEFIQRGTPIPAE